MRPEALIGIIFGCISVITAIIHVIYQMGRISLKVDTLWDLVVKSAKVEMVQVGWGKPGSDIEITPTAYQKLLPYLPEMVGFYEGLRAKKLDISEREVLLEFGKRFGDRLFEDIAIPSGVSPTMILLAAIQICEANWKKEHVRANPK